MNKDELLPVLSGELQFSPTEEQREALARLSLFLLSGGGKSTFILRGYAGTGKTTLVAAMVRALHKLGQKVVLLAPTGRAAKVFSHYSGYPAYTIHKAIYRQKTFEGEDTAFSLDYNRLRDTLFIVDEASMIANSGTGGSLFGSGRLLDDLVQFVYNSPGCRLVLVGDTAQLPPVGEDESPALSTSLMSQYGLHIFEANLRQVVRQLDGSGVLWNATRLRSQLQEGATGCIPQMRFDGFADIHYINGSDIIDALESSYDDIGIDQTIVITRSNKRANAYNNGIRATTFGREAPLTRGDLIMVVKNNYFWIEQYTSGLGKEEVQQIPMDFIANGDIAEVVHISHETNMYGFQFADVTLRFPDYDDFEIDTRVLLDTLQSEAPALTHTQSLQLFNAVLEDYQHLRSKREQMKKLRADPYFNALQIKYAYAVTCHKAQGGQWETVFLDQGYVTPEMMDTSYLRWLYTALTRATQDLYLVNWPRQQTDFNGKDDDY